MLSYMLFITTGDKLCSIYHLYSKLILSLSCISFLSLVFPLLFPSPSPVSRWTLYLKLSRSIEVEVADGEEGMTVTFSALYRKCICCAKLYKWCAIPCPVMCERR